MTDSMFKGRRWMEDNRLSWKEYLGRCRQYGYALYVSGKDKLGAQDITELNYQFLNTLSITDEEFRPKDLPLGWRKSPERDSRNWITKTTEVAYYRLVADRHFNDKLEDVEVVTERCQYGQSYLKRTKCLLMSQYLQKSLRIEPITFFLSMRWEIS